MTFNVTGTVAGDPCAPVAVMVTFPLYAPAVRAPTEAFTCSVCGAVPLVGDKVSQF